MKGLAASLALFAAALPAHAELLPAWGAQDAYRPAIAAGADGFLVVWQAGRRRTGDLVGMRLDAQGAPLDAVPFLVSGASDDQERPRIAFGDGVFLVVWQDLRSGRQYDLYAARVLPDGTVLDPDGIAIARGERNEANPAVAFDGTHFVVVWEDFSTGHYEIWGQRLGSDGTLVDAAPVVVAAPPESYHQRVTPALATRPDGTAAVVWSGSVINGIGVKSGVSVLGDGTVQQSLDWSGSNIPGDRNNPVAVAASPAGLFCAVWRGAPDTGRGSGTPVSSLLFDETWTPGRSGGVSLGGPLPVAPVVVWNGSAFAVAWHEQRDQQNGALQYDEVFWAQIETDGTREAARPVAGTREAPARAPAIAVLDGVTIVAYEQHPETADVPILIGVATLTP